MIHDLDVYGLLRRERFLRRPIAQPDHGAGVVGGLFRARWSEDVHREWMKAVNSKRPDIDLDKLTRIRELMDLAVPDALVTAYEHLIPSIQLPDQDDRHVLAAAIAARSSVIVTFNHWDFPPEVLEPFGIHTEHPDSFILDIADLEPETFLKAVDCDLQHYRNPPLTAEAYATDLRRAGIPQCADHLIQLWRAARSKSR